MRRATRYAGPWSILQRGGDGGEEPIDVRDVMVNAKAEAKAPIASVDDDMVVPQPLVDRGRVVHLEGEEVAARHAGRGHEVSGGKRLQSQPQQPVEEMLLQHRRAAMDRAGIDARWSSPVP